MAQVYANRYLFAKDVAHRQQIHRSRLAALKTRKRTQKDKLGCDNTPPKYLGTKNNPKKLQEKQARKKKLAKENLQLMRKLFEIKSRDPNGKFALDMKPQKHKFVSKAGHARNLRQRRILRENIKMMESISMQKGTLAGTKKWEDDRAKIEVFLKRMRRHPTVGYLPQKSPSPNSRSKPRTTSSSSGLSTLGLSKMGKSAFKESTSRSTKAVSKNRDIRERSRIAATAAAERKLNRSGLASRSGDRRFGRKVSHSRNLGQQREHVAPIDIQGERNIAEFEERAKIELSNSFRIKRCIRGINLDITTSKQGNVVTIVAYDKAQRYKMHLHLPGNQGKHLKSDQIQLMLSDIAHRLSLSFPTDKDRVKARNDSVPLENSREVDNGIQLIIGQTENEAATKIQSRIRVRGAKKRIIVKKEEKRKVKAVGVIQRHARGKIARKKVLEKKKSKPFEDIENNEDKNNAGYTSSSLINNTIDHNNVDTVEPLSFNSINHTMNTSYHSETVNYETDAMKTSGGVGKMLRSPQPRLGNFPVIGRPKQVRSGKNRKNTENSNKNARKQKSSGNNKSKQNFSKVNKDTPDGTRVRIANTSIMKMLTEQRWIHVFGPNKSDKVRVEYPMWAGLFAYTDGAVDTSDDSVRIRDVAISNRSVQVPVIDGGAWWPIELLLEHPL